MSCQNIFQRYELKYLVTNDQREIIMNEMSDKMKGDQYGKSTICNIYFDLPNYYLIRKSLEKPAYKEKLRVRSYGTANPHTPVFVELKKKYKDVVYKRRISLPEREAMYYLCSDGTGGLPGQIGREIDYFRGFYENLQPRVFLSYDREAFYAKDDDSFRVTFDENIQWRDYDLSLTKGAYGKPILQPNQSLMEIKVGSAMPLWMVSILTKNKIYKTSFSKYGRAYQDIMQNGGAVYQVSQQQEAYAASASQYALDYLPVC